MEGYKFDNINIPAINCPIVDNKQAFIPILTNNINSVSGWPDIAVSPFTSKPGLYKESWSIIDDIARYYETFDIDASFRNTRGDPILYLFYIWLNYSSLVFEGRLIPYIDFITENEIDYNTRIYRLVLDHNRDKVTKIAATGASFPISVPMGSFFDYNHEKPFNDQNKDITIRFRCMGVDYQDDILIKEFNDTVCIFNPSMKDGRRQGTMVRIKKNTKEFLNNRGYPRIDPDTHILEWWSFRDTFSNHTQSFLRSNLADPEQINNSEFGD
jgi:hypothetical protein